MPFVYGEVDANIPGIFSYPKPYYDYGGRVLYYDGFEDGILRWTQNDNQGGQTPPGITHITSRISRSGTKCLQIHMPRGNTNFQDANIGLQAEPLGAFPIIGLEAQLFILADSCRIGFSIERFNASSNSKYEWRVEYNVSGGNAGQWRHIYGVGGGSGENILAETILSPSQGAGGAPQGGIPGYGMWTPVKLLADLSNTGAAGLILHSGELKSTATAGGVNDGGEAYGGAHLPADMVKVEFHVNGDGGVNACDFYIDDVYVTVENVLQ